MFGEKWYEIITDIYVTEEYSLKIAHMNGWAVYLIYINIQLI